MRLSLVVIFGVLLGTSACDWWGDDETSPPVPGGGGTGSGVGTDSGGGGGTPQPTWKQLIGGHWKLDQLREGYHCISFRATEDIWISAIRPAALRPTATPHGTMQMLLSIADKWPINANWLESGEYPCMSSAVGDQMLFASGAGSGDLVMPAGVAMHIPAGKAVILQMHNVNFTNETIEGDSGILIQTGSPVPVERRADMFFLGRREHNVSIPNNGQPYELPTGCSMPMPWTIFALWPHMHGVGIHSKMVLRPDGGSLSGTNDLALLDSDYDILDQGYTLLGERKVGINDQLLGWCIYNNTTTAAIGLGDSIVGEQCFFAVYKYSTGGSPYFCTSP